MTPTMPLVLLMILPAYVLGCMPGYEGERERLREHLGIEWVRKGLAQSGFEEKKSIRHATDLNCNFSDPGVCQWKNMEDAHRLDSLDFYLFEKTDFTEFPPFRVGPGPTKLQIGDKMIFTGDKKREEQTAILFSSPIGCQNTTGNLTFTYWVYNSARVEVLIIEDLPEGGYKVAPEKPYVDCGTIHLNTECHAMIPPRETPFRLGIRAYEMATREGSFVMVDNIMYSATLCRVSIDLGDDFASFAMQSAAQGMAISSASQLDCSEFNNRCRWRSGAEGKAMWKRSSSALPREFLFNTTGNYIAPEGTYAILYIEQDSKAPLDVLRSDPINCQSQTENELKFRFWKTREVNLEACAVDLTGKDVECQNVPAGHSPAPVTISFLKAAKNFELAIRVKSFNPAFDSAVIVDDISYRATLCSDALSVFDLGERFLTTPMLSVILNRHINSAAELSCDFAKRAADCLWAPAGATGESELADASWNVGHGPLNEEKFYSLTTRREMPEGDFAVARFETGGTASLISEVIRCALQDVSIQFGLWTTGSAMLQVCLLDEAVPALLDCQQAQPGQVVVDLPSIERPFRIALRAASEDQGLVLVDNIKVQGEVCPALVRQFSSKSFRPAADLPDTNVCRLLSCNFQNGHACLYESSSIANGAMHRVINKQLEVNINSRHPVAIIESPPFRLNTVARLHFTFESSGDANLFVCNDSASKELESCFKVETRKGDDYIELLPSDTKVYLISRLAEGGTNGRMIISDLRLTDVNDSNAC